MVRPPLTAVVHLRNVPEDAAVLKRLALIFDRIYYIPRAFRILSERALSDPSRYSIDSDGDLRVHQGINYFFDTDELLENLESQPATAETIFTFREAGILNDPPFETLLGGSFGRFEQIRSVIAALDLKDADFLSITGWDVEDASKLQLSKAEVSIEQPTRLWRLDAPPEKAEVGDASGVIQDLPEPPPPGKTTLWVLRTPPPLQHSEEITTLLGCANAPGVFPIFTDPYHRRELAHCYARYVKGLSLLNRQRPADADPLLDFKAVFGEVAFDVTNSVFSSQDVADRSAHDILRYRLAMDEARRRFVSGDLMEIAELVSEPWTSKTKAEVEKYITGKLNADLAAFDAASKDVWEKLYGDLAVGAANAVRNVAAGGGLGGLTGTVIPNASGWEMAVVGALVGAVSRAPHFIKPVVEAMREIRSMHRSSIAYIGQFWRSK
jgi:hypothetical protein